MEAPFKIKVTREYICRGLAIVLRGEDPELKSKKFVQFSTVKEDNVKLELATEFQKALANEVSTVPGYMRISYSTGVVVIRFHSEIKDMANKYKLFTEKLDAFFEII